MKFVLIATTAVLLGGCVTPAAQQAQQAAADDAKCLSYGARRGDPAYVQCRSQLDAARTQAAAVEDAAPLSTCRSTLARACY
jgi:hypothetical protein